MHNQKFVFAQIVAFLDIDKFRYIVRTNGGDKYVKHFSCWNQLLTLMLGQLSARNSMRDLINLLNAHPKKLYHLGVGKRVTLSNLSKANEQRSSLIFKEFAVFMISLASHLQVKDVLHLEGHVYAFDSSTIDLCLSLFDWAEFRSTKSGIKLHMLYDVELQIPAFFLITNAKGHDSTVMNQIPYQSGAYYIFDRAYNAFKWLNLIHQTKAYFVVRAKTNLLYNIVSQKTDLEKDIRIDAQIELTGTNPRKYYPQHLRMVRFWDEEKKREFTFLTNNNRLKASKVALLYKQRWLVELFFKWIKQHLQVKKFWGQSRNAVEIQIYVAIITYCLVTIIKDKLQLKYSIYEILQILGASLFDTTPLAELLSQTNFQNVKEHDINDRQLMFNF